MPPRLISRAQLSRLAGVSKMAVTKQCGKGLASACIGDRVDLDHASVRVWLASHGVDPSGLRPEQDDPGTGDDPCGPSTDAIGQVVNWNGADIEQLLDLTLRQITDHFGESTPGESLPIGFKDYLDLRKKIADTREKELKNDETEGRLIEREFVRAHVFGWLESISRKLLSDSPRTIARRIYGMRGAGEDLESAERVVRDLISSVLEPDKKRAVGALSDV